MGGEDEDKWDIHPEREAIIIGTQDILLSRARIVPARHVGPSCPLWASGTVLRCSFAHPAARGLSIPGPGGDRAAGRLRFASPAG
ncbi:MAG: hypothetical protein A49_23960 [Methyloceanibacter sp.]|nr:MAG: hypothetical protein A49_23960 [Methyloceanibacter sp.]